MAILEIKPQFQQDATHTTQVMRLDDVSVFLITYQNKVDGLCYLDVLDEDGIAIVQGISLVVGLDLWYRFRYTGKIPPGILFVADRTAPTLDPGLTSFQDKEASLYYQEADA